MAQVLGLSKTAASNRYIRALERLKDLLKATPELRWHLGRHAVPRRPSPAKSLRLRSSHGQRNDRHPASIRSNRLAEEYLERRRRGERPTAAEYAARYPELAARILELFPALELIEGLKPTPADDGRASRTTRVSASEARPAGRRSSALGDYTLLRELGRGGMGIVYEAEHESLKSRVALKVMHPRFRADRAYVRRFQTEARSAAKLHHTNIVPVFDYGEQDGVCYYAMQCIVGSRPGAGARRRPPAAGRGRPRHRGSDRRSRREGHGDRRPAADPLAAISRGLLTGRFADAPAASGRRADQR